MDVFFLCAVGAGKPVVDTELSRLQIMDWLLSYAIGMEYSDRSDKLSKIVEHKKSQPPSNQEKQGAQGANRPDQPWVLFRMLLRVFSCTIQERVSHLSVLMQESVCTSGWENNSGDHPGHWFEGIHGWTAQGVARPRHPMSTAHRPVGDVCILLQNEESGSRGHSVIVAKKRS